MERHGFICAGCWTLDRVKLIDAWPVQETLANIVAIDRQGGGSAHNVGIDLRKLDSSMPVATIGLLGNDADGDFLMKQAEANGLDTAQLHRTSLAQTSFTDVMTVQSTGKRTFFHSTGANALLTPAHFEFSGTRARMLHLGLLGVHEQLDRSRADGSNGWVEILGKAKQAGLQTSIELVSIDPARNRALALPCLPLVDVLIVNDHEIGALAGIETLTFAGHAIPERCREALSLVLAKGAMQLVAVHYPEGAICMTRDGEVTEMPSLPVNPNSIQGSVGAGDAFAAGMLYALHERWPVLRAMRLGHAAAAASLRSTTTVGAVESVAGCLALGAE